MAKRQELFEGGIRYYTFATAHISFPENKVVCRFCPLLETYAREQCRLTGEYLLFTDLCVGGRCPLTFTEQKEIEKIKESEKQNNAEI